MSENQEGIYEALAQQVVEQFNELDKNSANTLGMAEQMIRYEAEHEDSFRRQEMMAQESFEKFQELLVEELEGDEKMEDDNDDGDHDKYDDDGHN